MLHGSPNDDQRLGEPITLMVDDVEDPLMLNGSQDKDLQFRTSSNTALVAEPLMNEGTQDKDLQFGTSSNTSLVAKPLMSEGPQDADLQFTTTSNTPLIAKPLVSEGPQDTNLQFGLVIPYNVLLLMRIVTNDSRINGAQPAPSAVRETPNATSTRLPKVDSAVSLSSPKTPSKVTSAEPIPVHVADHTAEDAAADLTDDSPGIELRIQPRKPRAASGRETAPSANAVSINTAHVEALNDQIRALTALAQAFILQTQALTKQVQGLVEYTAREGQTLPLTKVST